MAMDAAKFEALWRHTALIKYAKPNYKGFSRIILLQIFISSDKQSFAPE